MGSEKFEQNKYSKEKYVKGGEGGKDRASALTIAEKALCRANHRCNIVKAKFL